MDIILHKKLLALQYENAALREQLEQLKETSPESRLRYKEAAPKDLEYQGIVQGRSVAHGSIARAQGKDKDANVLFRQADEAARKALRRRSGLLRADYLDRRDAVRGEGN